MSNNKIDKPIIIYAAEEIYLKVSNIKKGNPEISVVEAVERYIGSESYNYLGSGEFHNKLFNNLSKKKFPTKILEMLMMQKKIVVEQFKDENRDYFAKSQFPLSSTQSKIGFIWRMCESYELWCKEIGKTKLITLRVSD